MVYNETKMFKRRGSKSVGQGVRRHKRRKPSDEDHEVDWECDRDMLDEGDIAELDDVVVEMRRCACERRFKR